MYFDILNRLVVDHESDGPTDGRTDRRTEPPLAIARNVYDVC